MIINWRWVDIQNFTMHIIARMSLMSSHFDQVYNKIIIIQHDYTIQQYNIMHNYNYYSTLSIEN